MTAPLFDLHELARRLSVSPNTARKLVTSGKCRSIKVGSTYRISETDYAEFCHGATVHRSARLEQKRPLLSVVGAPLKRIRL